MREIHLRFQEKNVGDQWVVLVPRGGGTDVTVFGPMQAKEAQAFAQFMSKEVDPATAFKMQSPVLEVLGFYESEMARNDCTHGADCPVHPNVNGLHNLDGIEVTYTNRKQA